LSIEAPAGPHAQEPEAAESQPQAHSGWLLAVCCIAQFMVILDLSIVNVALPSIQLSLNFSSNDLQWVVDAYTITFAGFLLLGGRAADAFGQRRMFVAALVLFSLTSLVGGLAPDQLWLVVARAAQGLAGALMAASSLAIITSSFPPGPKLHRAVSTWAAMNGLGGAAGVLFGGVITQALTWRWILLINPPIGLATVLIAYRVVVDRRRAENAAGFDVPGALMLTIGQMVLVYGVVEAGLEGWSAPGALIPIVVGFAMLGLFALIETRFAINPLVPFKELTKPLQTANNIVVLFSAALFPMWLVNSLYLQQVLGLSPLDTGLIMLPLALTIMITASRAGRLVNRFGLRPVLCSGLAMMTTGLLLLGRVGSSGSGVVWVMIPGFLVAAGIAMSIVPSTIAATQGAKPGQAGLASGIVNTSRQVGGGLGIAFLVTLATQRSSQLIGHGSQVPQALTGGFRLAYLIAAGLCALALLLALTSMPKLVSASAATARRFVVAVGLLLAVYAAGDVAFAHSTAAPLGAYRTTDTYSYVTAPGLHPPKIRTDQKTLTAALAPGYIFMANFYNVNYPPITGQSGPLILNDKMQPVWFKPVPIDDVAGNLAPQTYEGKPALSWWQGIVTNTGATETGEDIVVNQHYKTVATLRGKDGWKLTLHEFVIRGNDAWVTANKDIPYDLSRYGGAYNGAIEDSAVQEYDLRTGRLLFSWDAIDHIPPGDSYATLPTNGFPWDAYHVNSIDVLGNGTFLVSMRDMWAAYLVDIKSKRIIWTLGGRHSSFKIAPSAEFQWQHDVYLQDGGREVTMFDDHCCQLTGGGTYVAADGNSRALTLRLDQQTRTATLLHQYGAGVYPSVDYMGDLEPLSNGNVFVGWGSDPYFTEFTKNGTPLLDAVLPGSDLSYRAYVDPWVGQPSSPPAAAARRAGSATDVYASWNGATQVTSWRVLAAAGGKLRRVAQAAKGGFETKIRLAGSYASFEVQALNAAGKVIGTSKTFRAH
jgi:EmrB/QacA subfamily drug resistance transporter